ncbi:MAG: EAL domain-containing protein [Lachnospiraceae bacterium]|nr:EAL domain-containing protein [Lachnospiraceae bacterium]
MGPIEIALIIVSLICIILVVALVVVYNKAGASEEDIEKYISDNKKLYAKVQALNEDLRETEQAEANLNAQFEDLRERYEDVNRVAYTDKLTDLPNYQQFTDIFDGVMSTIRENEKCSISLIRLANYDRITNLSGHVAGDELILDFCSRLKANLTEDDFVARIGPDEFAVISQNFDDIEEFKDRFSLLGQLLRTPFESGGQDIIPTVYMASTLYPTDGKTSQLLSLNVRLALSHAISGGEPKVYFYEEKMANEAMRRMEILAGINRAAADENFTYLCGAQIDLKSGKVASFEIIPAWDSPAYGRLYPKDYLKYAEDTPIAKRIFSQLFAATCGKQQIFNEAGYENVKFIVPCFVNQFIDEEFVKIVYDAIESSDADPNRMLIAVPESVILNNPGATTALMKKIRKLGIRFVLDDFGAVSSSLKTLSRAPFSYIRLSKNLLDGETVIESEKILKSFTELAHSWDLLVIATGVDVKQQEELYRKMRVDLCQGELYNGFMADEVAVQIARVTGSK